MKYLLPLLVLIVSCKFSDQKVVNDVCNELDFSQALCNDIHVVTSYDDIKRKLGEPDVKRDSCGGNTIKYKQGTVHYSCFNYKSLEGITFTRHQDTVFISDINFSVSPHNLKVGSVTLNSEFSISDLKTICSDFDTRFNKNPDIYAVTNELDYVRLKETTDNRQKPYKNEVSLFFKDDKLVRLFYEWNTSYTDEQWKNYLEVKKELDKKGSAKLRND